MSIQLSTPIVVEQQTKTYDKIWINTININADDPQKQVTFYASVTPYCDVDHTILRRQIQNINVSDVFYVCQDNPTLANAVGAIYEAVEELCKVNNLFGMTISSIPATNTGSIDTGSLVT